MTEEMKNYDEMSKVLTEDKKMVVVHTIMQLQNKINEMKAMKEEALKKVKIMIPDERFSLLEARALVLDTETLKKLDMSSDEDWSKVKEVYTFEDGGMLHFTGDPDLKELKAKEMHRDFLIYLKTMNEETEKFNKLEKEHKETIENLFQELSDIIGISEVEELRKYSNFGDYLRTWMKDAVKREDLSQGVRNRIQSAYDASTRGITLEYMKTELRETLKSGNKSILYGYKNNFDETIKRAVRILNAKFGERINSSLIEKIYDFEKRVIPEYTEFNNLFVYLLCRFIKHNHERFNVLWSLTIGETFVQLVHLLENEKSEAAIEFEKNVKEILDMATK